MFTRIVECHVKPEKKDEFNNKLRSEVLPILQKQPGFVDLIALASERLASGTANRMPSVTIRSTSSGLRRS